MLSWVPDDIRKASLQPSPRGRVAGETPDAMALRDNSKGYEAGIWMSLTRADRLR